MKKLMLVLLALLASASVASAQYRTQYDYNRPRYDYGGPPHVGPVTSGTFYDGGGRITGRTMTDSAGSTTVYGRDGSIMGRTSTDSQGTTTYYGPDGRKVGTGIPDGRR
jgi:hypothetical protein